MVIQGRKGLEVWTIFTKFFLMKKKPFSKRLFIFELSKYLRINTRLMEKMSYLRTKNNTLIGKSPDTIKLNPALMYVRKNRLDSRITKWIFRIKERRKRILARNHGINKRREPGFFCIKNYYSTYSEITNSLEHQVFQSWSRTDKQDFFMT